MLLGRGGLWCAESRPAVPALSSELRTKSFPRDADCDSSQLLSVGILYLHTTHSPFSLPLLHSSPSLPLL